MLSIIETRGHWLSQGELMRKLGLAVCIMLVSGIARAGSIEIPINGGVGRLHIDETCTDRLCGTASWTDGDTGQTVEFALPNVSWKEIEALAGAGLPSGASKRKSARPEKSNKAAVPATRSAPAAPASTSDVAKTAVPAKPIAPPASTAAPPVSNAEPPASAAAAAPSVPADAAPAGTKAAAPAPEPKLAAIPPSAPAPAPIAAAPAVGPVGLWMTENQEGMVRVEQCGQAICGYEVNGKTHQNGKKVLIDMRPSGKSWKGRIHDPRGGGTYDSTVLMKGKDTMRVEGCALGGLFCGGQTWTRVN